MRVRLKMIDERSGMDAKRSKLMKASSAVAVALAFYGAIALSNRRTPSERVERWMFEHMNPYAGGPVHRPVRRRRV